LQSSISEIKPIEMPVSAVDDVAGEFKTEQLEL